MNSFLGTRWTDFVSVFAGWRTLVQATLGGTTSQLPDADRLSLAIRQMECRRAGQRGLFDVVLEEFARDDEPQKEAQATCDQTPSRWVRRLETTRRFCTLHERSVQSRTSRSLP
jgi:hypothetical protein